MALKKSELYSSLWQSCDELRGGMDASQYKDYVLVLLFVKYVSDKYGGQKDALIEVPAGGSFADMVALKGKKHIGDKMNTIIGALAEANDLKGVIDVADFNDDAKLGSGKEMQDRLTNLVGIFQNPDLDFSKHRADDDDLLGDAYEYLMRHFATESGKSKGQFYTPAEVSRIMARVIGIDQAKRQDQTIYDPTCGSGSLLLKAADLAARGVTIYGQEKDVATRALAKMNMILHGEPTAEVERGNSLSKPLFKNRDGSLKTFDYVVANPPFSDKAWRNGFDPFNDEYSRFEYGVPPAKKGDYAYLLHVVRSLKSTGKGVIVMPHGVLFRGNVEADIRQNLIRNGYIKGIIGLPANLFYGTGIPACLIVLDKVQANAREGVFMIDASKGFVKDGNKNRLREQDIHRIVDVFNSQNESDPKYARIVPVSEIERHEYNLNIPRYIDSTEPEDIQDIEAHLLGGIPDRNINALGEYWEVYPNLRKALFKKADRSGYSHLRVPQDEIKQTIFEHPEFVAYSRETDEVFAKWRNKHRPGLKAIEVGANHPGYMGYRYLGNWEDREGNSNIEEDILREFLSEKQGYSERLVNKALYELNKVARDQSKSLYEVNKEVYRLLRYGVKVREDVGENKQTVSLINWEEAEKNDFAIAEEVTVISENTKRPDVVLYVNGIALGVIELKRSIVSVSEGIRQNLDNQKKIFIQSFFNTMQLVMAGNDTEGLRYGVIETPEKYYLTWKEDSNVEPLLDRHISQLCQKRRLLELIHDFVVFDAGVKKICRHHQYLGVKAAQSRVRQREGGIIWHTQGSGKSLVMVWLAKWIRENVTDARVLIITDRKELDEQIERIFLGVNEEIYRCKSGKDMINRFNAAKPSLLCSLVHKFANREDDDGDYEGFIRDVMKNIPKDFKAKGDIYVFVDECHRTQSGELHKAMKQVLPNALFIGFTGTPLLKKDKQKSIEVFGKYIHTYKFDEAVKDKVVLDLRYEARDIDQNITSEDKIDTWFDAKTRGLNDFALTQLKKKWGTIQKVFSSQARLEKIVADILLDMATKDRLQSGRGNAMLVSGSIYEACKFYELFVTGGFTRCAIVTSYTPSTSDIKGEETGEGLTEKLRQYDIYNKMLDGRDPETFEKDAKKQFVDEPGQMKLLIVVDKLLTGFDAPSATYLYIDKKMQDHGLFQAICRVNRLDGVDKEYGYVIDYKDLFKSLEKSVDVYTSGALDGYDKEDVEGLLQDRLAKAKERLEETRESIKALCEPIGVSKETLAYIHYFCGKNTSGKDELKDNEQKRHALYTHTSALIRAYANLANEIAEAGYSAEEIATIKREVDHFEKARSEVKLASGDYIDLKVYEPAMRHLIDTYIRAEESEVIAAFDDMTLLELIVERGADAVEALPRGIGRDQKAVAETIENNLRKVIIDEQPVNPKYYDTMSTLLNELIKQRREQSLEYEQYLARVVELTKKVKNPGDSKTYPNTLDTSAKRALYDNLEEDEALALALDKDIRATKKDEWRGHRIKERAVRNVVKKHVEEEDVDRVFDLVVEQSEY